MEERKSKDEMNEIVEEILDPQVTSADPNERRLARKLRIERRIEALKRRVSQNDPLMYDIPDSEEFQEDKTLLEQQLQRSAKVIEMLLLDSEEHITNIRVANDSREVDRREAIGVAREKVLDKLQEEAVSATEVFDRIADRWINILKYNDPLLINDELIHQKEKCDELIILKDGVIAMLKDELAVGDKMFYDDQIKQNDDIHVLAKRIEKQVQLVRKAYRQELAFIENVVMIERQMLIGSNDKKWEEFYKRRDNEEKANIERKFEQQEEFGDELTKLRVEHQEIFRESKIRLENDIEDLQKEFEQIKAVALINSEKMDYNYQILRKREDENIIIKSQQKRRINKLQDNKNDLRYKLREYDKSTTAQILKLTDEVFALQKCVLEQEAKSESMAKVNDLKYSQVWELNKITNTKLLDKILTIDQIIYDQLLGLPWKKPIKQVWEKENLPSYKLVVQQQNMSVIRGSNSPANRSSFKMSIDKANQPDRYLIKRLLINILDQISSKSGFLVEYRLKHVLDPYSYAEHVLVRIDNIFAALGIKEKEDLDSIIDFFLPYAYCPICVKQSTPITSMKSMQFSNTSKTTNRVGSIDQQSVQSFRSSSDKDDEQDQSESLGSETAVNVMGDISQAVRQPDYVIIDTIRQLVYTTISQMNLSNVEAIPEHTVLRAEDDNDSQDIQLEAEIMEKVHSSKKSTVGFRLTCNHRHPLIINSMYVLRALREFINNYFMDHGVMQSTVDYISISRELQKTEVEDFWKRFKIIFAEAKQNLWDGLLEGLKKYHAILLDRQKVYDDLLKQRKENEELKALYLRYQSGNEVRTPCAEQRIQPYRGSPVLDIISHTKSDKLVKYKQCMKQLQMNKSRGNTQQQITRATEAVKKGHTVKYAQEKVTATIKSSGANIKKSVSGKDKK